MLICLRRLALAWERLWPPLWPVVGIFGAFLALALGDVLPLLPGWLHILMLVAFVAAIAVAAVSLVRRYRPADADAARHRLERNNQLAHRPLTALADHLAAGRDDARASAPRGGAYGAAVDGPGHSRGLLLRYT